MAESDENAEMGDFEDFGGDGVDYSGNFVSKHNFQSDFDAISWAKQVAIKIGFELIVGSHKREGTVKLLICSRGARYRGAGRDMETALRRKTKTKACKCPFKIAAKQIEGSTNWRIGVWPGIKGTHNHILAEYPEGYRQMSGLSPASKKIVQDMSSAQAKPCHILAALKEKNPDDNPTIRHVYNYRDALQRESFDDRNVATQFFHLAGESNYFVRHQADPDTRVLTHVFAAHPESVKLFRKYYLFIGMDSTYKTNRYHMPLFEITGMTPCNKNFMIAYAIMLDETEVSYYWVLRQLRLLIGSNVEPNVVVTDRELGLIRPIREVFPNNAHLLCTWHINKDVEHYACKVLGKDGKYAELFKNTKWKKILEASIETEYEKAVQHLRVSMKKKQQLVTYIEDTWLVHKEKFVKAWTNKVLHFGNTTTCRVESAHAQLKQWLNSSTGSLDTVWHKVHREVDSQVSQIRYTLEECRRRVGAHNFGPPFHYLACRVSHYCLDILNDEYKRMNDLSFEVNDRCGCVLRGTHGLPCACVMKNMILNDGVLISVDQIHIFWKSLVYDTDEEETSYSQSGCVFEDHRCFMELVDEVKGKDAAVVRRLNYLINDELHPEHANYYEPEVKTKVKGRPKNTNAATKRIPSRWEPRSRGRGRSSSSSTGRGRSSSSSVHNASTVDEPDIAEYFYVDNILQGILPYVEGYLDVAPDGNCGFRVIASYVFSSEHSWRYVRQCIIGELQSYRSLYERIYFDGLDEAIGRINWDGGRCDMQHWMIVADDLYPIATFFTAVVFYFGQFPGQCLTILPLRAPPTFNRPELEIVIQYLGTYRHFIRLNLRSDFPVPPIAMLWHDHHDRSVEGWDRLYDRRRLEWDRHVVN